MVQRRYSPITHASEPEKTVPTYAGYENLFRRGLPRDQALRAAKDYVRHLTVGDMRPYRQTDAMRERYAEAKEAYRESFDDVKKRSDTHRPYRDPYYWGAFILVGKTDPDRLGAAAFRLARVGCNEHLSSDSAGGVEAPCGRSGEGAGLVSAHPACGGTRSGIRDCVTTRLRDRPARKRLRRAAPAGHSLMCGRRTLRL